MGFTKTPKCSTQNDDLYRLPRVQNRKPRKNEKKTKKKGDGRGGERGEHRKKRALPDGGRRSEGSERAAHVVRVDERERASEKTAQELAEDVKAFVDGKAGTKVEAVSGVDVEDVVEALKKAGVPNVTDATERRRGAASGKGGLDVEVVVREGPKEAAKFVAGVEVVPVREVQCGDTELRGVDLLGLSVEWADRNLDVRKTRDGGKVREVESLDALDKPLGAFRT